MSSPEQACAQLLQTMQTLQISTVGNDGVPYCGYTPYLFQQPCSFYIFISQLAVHTRDIQANGQASIMVIQDEAATDQIFARTRVSYRCQCHWLAPDAADYDSVLDQYQSRHGKMVGLLRQLPDFQLFRLQPISGQFVMGFGKAFRLSGQHLDVFEHTRTG